MFFRKKNEKMKNFDNEFEKKISAKKIEAISKLSFFDKNVRRIEISVVQNLTISQEIFSFFPLIVHKSKSDFFPRIIC